MTSNATRYLAAAALLLAATAADAQALSEPVTAAPDAETLFTSRDPKLNANKQVTLKIVKELLEAGHWDRAPLYLTKAYIQHNPLAASGLEAVMHFFVDVMKVQPKPVPAKMQTKVVAVTAEGDYVTVSYVRELKDPKDPSRTYTTTWFDMWRFKDGKADEHWDPATLPPAPASSVTAAASDGAMRQMQDRAQIESLMWRYVRAIDSFDQDAYAAVFTPDGAFGATRGRDALRKMVTDLKKGQDDRRAKGEPLPSMHHMMSNAAIDFVDPDHARYTYYWMTVFAGAPGTQPPRVAAAGRGIDDVTRVDGRWLIRNRNVAPTE